MKKNYLSIIYLQVHIFIYKYPVQLFNLQVSIFYLSYSTAYLFYQYQSIYLSISTSILTIYKVFLVFLTFLWLLPQFKPCSVCLLLLHFHLSSQFLQQQFISSMIPPTLILLFITLFFLFLHINQLPTFFQLLLLIYLCLSTPTSLFCPPLMV